MAKLFAGALTVREQEILADAYFTPWEINQFNKATTVDGRLQNLNFKADNFQTMIRDRINLVEKLKRKGWSRQRVINLINSYYENKRSKRTPFDLLQVEASPSAKQARLSDTDIARKLLKQTRIAATFGKGYTAGLPQTTIPRNIPRRPDIAS